MKRLISTALFILILSIVGLLYDFRNSRCVQAGCFRMPRLVIDGTYFFGNDSGNLNMGPTAQRACFLTKEEINEADGEGERAGCRIDVSGTDFILVSPGPGDSDAHCGAVCLRWYSLP